MRRRLVVSFVLVTVVLLLVMTLVRAFTLSGVLREHESEHVAREAQALAALVQARLDAGGAVTESFLSGYAANDGMLVYATPNEPDVVVLGVDFEPSADEQSAISSTVPAGSGTLTASQASRSWWSIVGYDPEALVMLLLLLALAAAVAGYYLSRILAGPCSQLARAADMLGRGRFDLDLPTTKIPEVQAVAGALEASAGALRDRLAREQQFSVHASHVLRTPLTSLRLHLDELDMHDLDASARASTARCHRSVAELQQVASDLVDITRRGALMSGAEIPLSELATQAAQRWADALLQAGRGFSAAVDGDLNLMLTPGPVEYVLDVMLEEAQRNPEGDVRLVFLGRPGVLRLEARGVTLRVDHPVAASSVTPGSLPRGPQPDRDDDASGTRRPRVEQAVSLVRSLGGRIEVLPAGAGTVVLMPPR